MSKKYVEFATNRIIDSVWTIAYKENRNYGATLLAYSRKMDMGYQFEDMLPAARLVELADRTVVGIDFIDLPSGKVLRSLEVTNPKHVFDYQVMVKS